MQKNNWHRLFLKEIPLLRMLKGFYEVLNAVWRKVVILDRDEYFVQIQKSDCKSIFAGVSYNLEPVWARNHRALVTWAFLTSSTHQIPYLALLKEYFPPILRQILHSIGDLVLQQDNAAVHETKSVIA